MTNTFEPDELNEACAALDTAVERFKTAMALPCSGMSAEYSLSFEANQNRFKMILERAKEMILKAYRWVRKVIREFISGHMVRLERFYDTLVETERKFNSYQKAGRFTVAPRIYIDNLSIARDLLASRGISFATVNQSNSNVNTLITVATNTYRNRVEANRKLLERAGTINTIEDLRKLVDLPRNSEMVRTPASQFMREELGVGPDTTVLTSMPLPSNRSLAFLLPLQEPGVLGFANAEYGMKFVRTQAIDMNDRRMFRMPVLSAPEIKTMIFNIRRNLSDLRNIVDSVNAAEDELERTESTASRLKLSEDATRGQQDLLLTFLTRSIRNDARLIVSTMSLASDFLFACHQWVEKSIETYLEGSK
jgi:hypothetical protein